MSILHRRNLRTFVSASISVALLLAAQTASASTPHLAVAHTAVVAAPRTSISTQSVGMQMFMWPWVSLKSECTDVLGPEKVDWILVSPPQEDVRGDQWWTHYQPVSYKLESQLGTEQEFAGMVSACNAAGVQVIVDAVINHMANSNGIGFAGTSFTKYSYPRLYDTADFHAGLAKTAANFCANSISNYNDSFQVENCELGGLPDLATEKASVRQKIVDYLNHLTDLGVSGFRIDAAKHIGLKNLSAIRQALNPVNGKQPYFLQESIGSAYDNQSWTQNGDVFAWDLQARFSSMFNGIPAQLKPDATSSSIIGDPNSTVIMVSNHDNEHHAGNSLTYRDGQKFLTANAYLLAHPQGKPMLYTGYAFTVGNYDAGPAATASGVYAPAICPSSSDKPKSTYQDGTFVCLERWTAIKGMIQWHHEAASSPTTNLVSKQYLLAFTRGTTFFAMNTNQQDKKLNAKRTVKVTLQTGLPAGAYCDVVSGGAAAALNGKCAGAKVVVKTDGTALLTVPPMTAIGLDVSNRIQ